MRGCWVERLARRSCLGRSGSGADFVQGLGEFFRAGGKFQRGVNGTGLVQLRQGRVARASTSPSS